MSYRLEPGYALLRESGEWQDEIIGQSTASSATFTGVRTVEGHKMATFKDASGREWAQLVQNAKKTSSSMGNPARKRPPPSCRTHAPPKYAQLGFTRRSDYAYPECWMYPVGGPSFSGDPESARKHTRSAASRFGADRKNVPAADRAAVEKRIDLAKRRWDIGRDKHAPTRANPTGTAVVPYSAPNPAAEKGQGTKMAGKKRRTKAQKIATLKMNLKQAKGAKKDEIRAKIAKLEGGKAPAKKGGAKKAAKKGAKKAKKASRKGGKRKGARKTARKAPKKGARKGGKRKTGGKRKGTAKHHPSTARANVDVKISAANPAGRKSSRGGHHKSGGHRKGHSRPRTSYSMSNPAGNWMNVAVLSGGVLGGFILGGIVDRIIATRTPKGGVHPWYGPDASARIAMRPGALRIAAGIGGGVALTLLSWWMGKKGWEKSAYVVAGLGIGWLVNIGANLWYSYAVGKLWAISKGDEMTWANRLYSDQQSYLYDGLANAMAAVDKSVANGSADPIFAAGASQGATLPPAWDVQLQANLKSVAAGGTVSGPPSQQGNLGRPAGQKPAALPQMGLRARVAPVAAPAGVGAPAASQPVAPAAATPAAAPAPAQEPQAPAGVAGCCEVTQMTEEEMFNTWANDGAAA
jgi:hypothetical protein